MKSKLGIYHDRWFKTYRGLIYKNGCTDVITAIHNKAMIESGKSKTLITILTISEKF